MAEREISVGDLVMVVRPLACGHGTRLGHIFRVKSLVQDNGICVTCNMPDPPSVSHEAALFYEGGGAMTYRLKRIQPLAELESEKKEEKVNG